MENSKIRIREVESRNDLKKFISLPYRIHKNHKEWLPPIREDEWKVFDHKKNAAFTHCDTLLLLAERDGSVVGRIMGIINRTYNNNHDEQDVRFCFLETYEDKQVFDLLLQSVESWGKEKGMNKIVGPIGFSGKNPQGFLIEGFDDPMTVMITNHSFRYMVDFMEQNGFTKKHDLVQYRIPIDKPLPDIYNKVADRVLQRGHYQVKEFTRTRDVKPFVIPIFELMNEAYKHLYAFSPLTKKESKEFTNRFLPVLNANFIKLILDDKGQLVAFILGMPDISKGIRQSNGRMFPFGFVPILWSMRKTRQLNLMLGCIEERHRNKGLNTVLAVRLLQSAHRAKFKLVDTQLVMEENRPMRSEFERVNAELYKKYRIYHKQLG